MRIVNAAGVTRVTYEYDAWGNIISTTSTSAALANANPLRYRGYIYDSETGLYYLNNRYYDPEMGRFISADAFVSTGQGFIGNNMFVYCGNNPVMQYDETGYVPQAVTDKIVHNKVLSEICTKQSSLSWTQTCIYYNGKNAWGGFGFCDLYHASTGEVWELKKQSNSYSCKTSTALRQLKKYVSGRLRVNTKLELSIPSHTEIADGVFSFTQNGYIYEVEYWSEGNGILRYSYNQHKTEGRKIAETFAAVAMVTTIMLIAPYAAPSTGVVFFTAP